MIGRNKPFSKNMSIVVSDDGKISIPQEVREARGLGPGSVLVKDVFS
jgi:bifunctional DNA-binding transcriptional regulator/antitoxin component of YhaV-PrlF toxin-antitoxin module